MSVDTSRFLRGLKRRITVPAAQQLIGDTGFLELGDDVMLDKMVPLVMSTRQDFPTPRVLPQMGRAIRQGSTKRKTSPGRMAPRCPSTATILLQSRLCKYEHIPVRLQPHSCDGHKQTHSRAQRRWWCDKYGRGPTGAPGKRDASDQ